MYQHWVSFVERLCQGSYTITNLIIKFILFQFLCPYLLIKQLMLFPQTHQIIDIYSEISLDTLLWDLTRYVPATWVSPLLSPRGHAVSPWDIPGQEWQASGPPGPVPLPLRSIPHQPTAQYSTELTSCYIQESDSLAVLDQFTLKSRKLSMMQMVILSSTVSSSLGYWKPVHTMSCYMHVHAWHVLVLYPFCSRGRISLLSCSRWYQWWQLRGSVWGWGARHWHFAVTPSVDANSLQ